MTVALEIDVKSYAVQELEMPSSPRAMQSAVLQRLGAHRLSIGAVLMTGEILLVNPDAQMRSPHFLFLGAGVPIAGAGIIVGPIARGIVAPVSFSTEDISERTIFMDWLDAREWFNYWQNEIDITVFCDHSLNCAA